VARHLLSLRTVAGLLVAATLLSAAVLLYRRLRRRAPTKWSSAGGLVLDDRDRVAIVLQRKRGRLRWTLPKGRIDAGETAEQAALREVFEETGLQARILRPLLLHEGPLHFTCYFEMALEHDHGTHDRETREVRFVPLFKAAKRVRSRRDLAVLRRLMELRTRAVAAG
jgi:8-oxo-dGTP pyrophosphatase MutT (NUDIX family)